jgi:hypothetical protein
MAFEEEDIYRERSPVEAVVGGLLRVGLLFGSLAVVAVALIVSQILDGRMSRDRAESQAAAAGIDHMPTGSIGYTGTYTVRRSVLQSSPNSVCVIRDNGTRSGDC